MEINHVGLILEGGAMRGVYTSGVLDFFLDMNLHFNYIIGVSAGACQSFSYVSKQRGRSFSVNARFVNDKRYLSIRNFIREGSIFGMDFMFDEIPRVLEPFDYEAFQPTNQKVLMAVTNCATGKSEYLCNDPGRDMFLACRASSSMPLLAPKVLIDGNYYLDGGIADPIPIRKSIEDGNEKNVIILTRNADYRKKPSKHALKLMKKVYKNDPDFCDAYSRRYQVYNDTLEYISDLEAKGEALVIRPVKPVVVKRTEKNVKKLSDFYEEGLKDASRQWERLKEFLEL